MDPLLAFFLLCLLCMAAMAPMMLFGGHRHWMGWYSDRAPRSEHYGATAREILDRRYANGDITKGQYEAMLVEFEHRALAD